MNPDPIQHLGLLLIDLQDGFLNAIPESEALLQRTTFIVEAAALLGLEMAVTEQVPSKLGPTNHNLKRRLPPDTPVFDKTGFSAFQAEGLERWIETNQIDHLLLAGIETPICVYQTAVDALGRELGVTLLSDAISERRVEDRVSVIQQLLSMEAHVLPSETVFYSLLGDAAHPKFRAFTKFVKEYT